MVCTTALVNRINWWLRSAASGSASNVCNVNNNGNANFNSATNDWNRPRVGLLILARHDMHRHVIRANEEGRAAVRSIGRKPASRWEGRPLLAWRHAPALCAVSLLLPMRPASVGAMGRGPCGAP